MQGNNILLPSLETHAVCFSCCHSHVQRERLSFTPAHQKKSIAWPSCSSKKTCGTGRFVWYVERRINKVGLRNVFPAGWRISLNLFCLYVGLHKFTVISLLQRHHVIFVRHQLIVLVLLHQYNKYSVRGKKSFQHNFGLCKFAVISLLCRHHVVFVRHQFTVILLLHRHHMVFVRDKNVNVVYYMNVLPIVIARGVFLIRILTCS